MREKLAPGLDVNGNVHQRIHAVMRAVRGVEKGSQHPTKKFRYAGHEAVTEALRDAMIEYGLLAVPNVIGYDRDGAHLRLRVVVSYVNIDDPADRIAVEVPGESYSQVSNRTNGERIPEDAQVGIALSYAMKLAHVKTFMLVGDSTPDPESRPSDGGHVAPSQPKEGALPPRVFESLIASYEGASSMEELAEASKKSRPLIATYDFSGEQLQQASAAYGAAAARIKQQGEQKK